MKTLKAIGIFAVAFPFVAILVVFDLACDMWDEIRNSANGSERMSKAQWIDGLCKSCGRYTRSCTCERPPTPDFVKKLFVKPTPSSGEIVLELTLRQAIIDWNRQLRPQPLNIDDHEEGQLADFVLTRIRALQTSPSPKPEPSNAAPVVEGLACWAGGPRHEFANRCIHCAEDAPEPEMDEKKALAEFTEYFVANYPGPCTIINDPKWHAPKIFRAAQSAMLSASLERTP